MKAYVPPIILACAAAYTLTSSAAEENIVASAPSTGGATVIYRQVLPSGRVVYSDKPIKGATIDHTLKVEPPIRGNLWTTEASTKPDIPPQTTSTPIRKVNVVPAPGQKKTVADADSEVIRAEMLLEDAKKRQQTGIEPLPGERTSTTAGTSRLNDTYFARQKALTQDVEQAEAALKQAITERDSLLHVR
jgi:hypothetical protein